MQAAPECAGNKPVRTQHGEQRRFICRLLLGPGGPALTSASFGLSLGRKPPPLTVQ